MTRQATTVSSATRGLDSRISESRPRRTCRPAELSCRVRGLPPPVHGRAHNPESAACSASECLARIVDPITDRFDGPRP
jgi:hypothetical protein